MTREEMQDIWEEEARNPKHRCPKCREVKSIDDFYDNPKKKYGKEFGECKECAKKRVSEYHGRGGNRKGGRNDEGISNREAREMLIKQNYLCACCEAPITWENGNVDHNHVTLKIRAFICSKCNTGLAWHERKLAQMYDAYLEKYDD